jgi:hypothetical protein
MLPCGRLGVAWLVGAHLRCSPLKAGSISQGPSNSHCIHFENTHSNRLELKNPVPESTPAAPLESPHLFFGGMSCFKI